MFNNSLIEPKKIIYSKRKTITLIINSKGELLVRAPIDCQISKIEKFIKEKADWIIKKRNFFQSTIIVSLNLKEMNTYIC